MKGPQTRRGRVIIHTRKKMGGPCSCSRAAKAAPRRPRASLTLQACVVQRCDVSRGCETHTWRRLYTRKQSRSIGRQQTVESLRRQRAASGSSASERATTRVNVEQAPKTLVAEADPPPEWGRPPPAKASTIDAFVGSAGVMTVARHKGIVTQHERSAAVVGSGTTNRRLARAGPGRHGSRRGS
jgi:hypothetical protein